MPTIEKYQKYKEYNRTYNRYYLRNWRKTHKTDPIKKKAWNAISHIFRRGRIRTALCEVCGAKNPEAHHDDYHKPLDVKWLCKRHHEEYHVHLTKKTNKLIHLPLLMEVK